LELRQEHVDVGDNVGRVAQERAHGAGNVSGAALGLPGRE
jgi:hypothetical protein